MKNYILKLGIVGLTILFFSCSKNEGEIKLNNFSGYYKIQSISSSLPIDLNNDGLKTNNYLQEIKSNYTSFNGEIINFGYDNELRNNFAQVRPTKNQSNNTKFLDIRFPIQRIDSIYQGNNSFVPLNMEYRKMYTAFIYKLTDNDVEIESDPFNQFEYNNINNFEINRITITEFEILFNFKVYDFTVNKYVETRLKAKYEKTQE